MSPTLRCIHVAVALVVLQGCAAESETPAFLKHDSAGISLFTNVIPPSPKACAISKLAEFSLDSGEYELEEFFAATVSPEGTLAAAARRTVIIIDSAGRVVKRFGRKGEGPGEFRQISKMWWASDTLVIGDSDPWRVQYFDAQGRYLDGVTPQPVLPNSPVFASILDDGSFIVAEGIGFARGAHVEKLAVKQILQDGTTSRKLGEFYNGSWAQVDGSNRDNAFFAKLFDARTSVAAAGQTVAIGDQSKQEIALNRGNELRSVLRWQFAGNANDRTVRAADIKAFIAEQEKIRTPQRSADIDQAISEKRPRATEFPAFSSVYLTNSGSVWVRMYRRPGDAENRYLRFQADGAFNCSLTLSTSTSVLQFTDDELLVHTTDETVVGEIQRLKIR